MGKREWSANKAISLSDYICILVHLCVCVWYYSVSGFYTIKRPFLGFFFFFKSNHRVLLSDMTVSRCLIREHNILFSYRDSHLYMFSYKSSVSFSSDNFSCILKSTCKSPSWWLKPNLFNPAFLCARNISNPYVGVRIVFLFSHQSIIFDSNARFNPFLLI